ncbi:hypothetical protein GW17_00035879 [Ensete ventricosum]|nr:hypothetical protein GW17_00035879 [Ensete ventricosum]
MMNDADGFDRSPASFMGAEQGQAALFFHVLVCCSRGARTLGLDRFLGIDVAGVPAGKKAMERKKYPIRAEDYQLREPVGQGVSASVYRALCIPLVEVVAIKIVDFERNNSDLVSSSVAKFHLFLIYSFYR